MSNQLDNLPRDHSPDSICGCAHQLSVHTFSCYQDMQKIMSLTGPMKMFPVNAPHTEWKCELCECDEFKVDNLRYLEHKLEQSER
jgi:hypothetical protein